jgi:hypothetical protein
VCDRLQKHDAFRDVWVWAQHAGVWMQCCKCVCVHAGGTLPAECVCVLGVLF